VSGNARRERLTPDQFRAVVSTVLRTGVVTAAALTAVGFAMSLLVGWNGSLLGAPPTASAPTDFSYLVSGLLALRPVAFAQAGLIVLIATPVLRVATSVVGFWLEADRLYVAITLGVLVILLGSIFLVH
jgi:uncharacterized membrane protein